MNEWGKSCFTLNFLKLALNFFNLCKQVLKTFQVYYTFFATTCSAFFQLKHICVHSLKRSTNKILPLYKFFPVPECRTVRCSHSVSLVPERNKGAYAGLIME